MSMYRIKPISVAPDNIELPKCMYHIKPLNGIQFDSFSNSLAPVKRVKMVPELQAIEDRQLQVIARLQQLRDTVDDLVKKTNGANPGQQSRVQQVQVNSVISLSSSSSAAMKDVVPPTELVIEANPNRPPLTLLFFLKLNPSLRILTHTHSSCDQKVDAKLNSLFCNEPPKPSGTVRVVWKNLSDSRLTPPSLESSGVEGESNVARYLSRILAAPDSHLNYDAVPLDDLVLVDGVLESSNLVNSSPDQFLSCLQAYVQQRSRGGARTIADFVGYSTLRFVTSQQPKASIQKSLADWMNCLTNEVSC